MEAINAIPCPPTFPEKCQRKARIPSDLSVLIIWSYSIFTVGSWQLAVGSWHDVDLRCAISQVTLLNFQYDAYLIQRTYRSRQIDSG
jgi:hypothetical protein